MKNRKTDLLIVVAALALMMGAAACNEAMPTPTPRPTPVELTAIQPMDSMRALTVHGMERSYFIHIPPGLNNQQSVALVFLFHGYSGNADRFRMSTGFNKISDASGFIAVYPNGTGASGALSWNAGGCCGYADQDNIDEPAFVRAIIADVETIVDVDGKRIYATGFSNGAFLAYRLACEMSETFAAVAPVAGKLLYYPCLPSQPVSLMHVHGLKDAVVPFEQGLVNPDTGQRFSPIRESVAAWAQLDGCKGAGEAQKNGQLTHTDYGPCAPGINVELDTIDGIDHFWPSLYTLPVSQMIWDFFAAHPKP